MEQFQLLRVCIVCLLAIRQCLAMPLGSQCVDESVCKYSLQDYSQLVNLPNRINERSIATWSYVIRQLFSRHFTLVKKGRGFFEDLLLVENIDLNRVPQIIHEARCHTSHSCSGLDNSFGIETIPVSLKMPVLKKNPSCFPTATYSLEFELITIACICAISRQS